MFKKFLVGYIVILAVVITSWVVNFNKLIDCDFEPSYKAEIIHGIGILPPVALVTAWIDVGK